MSKTGESEILRKINAVLLTVAVPVILAYIVFSNLLVSQKYLLNSQKAEFNRQSTLLADPNTVVVDTSLELLINFAINTGMVEAKDTVVLFSNSTFALEDQ